MTEKEKEQWLKAIAELREHYNLFLPTAVPPSYRRRSGNLCPLCQVDKKINISVEACKACLWVKFEGDTCGRNNWFKDTAQQRLDRLDRWEKRIEEEELK